MMLTMFDNILRRVRLEVELLMVVTVLSTVLSAFLIVDASIALGIGKYALSSTIVRILELIFAVAWLSLSQKIIVEINKLRRKHQFFYFVHKLQKLEEEQKKTKAAELIRDIMAFYRTYYLKVKALMVLAVVVSFVTILAVVYLWLYDYMSIWEAVFRWVLNATMLIFASAVYLYVHKNWGRKLLKVRDAEKKLSEFLGGPVEA